MLESHVTISAEDCIGCGLCVEMCPATPGVFEMQDITAVVVHAEACERCRLCTDNCPTDAIKLARDEDIVAGLGDV